MPPAVDLRLVKIAILAGGLVLLLLYAALGRRPLARRLLDVCLVGVAAAAVGAYVRFAAPAPNRHDLFHYYLGSKYAPEVGYFNLYPSTAVALADGGASLAGVQVNRLEDNIKVPAASYLADAERVRARFTPARWAEFRRDVEVFARTSRSGLRGELADAGYNPTPVWTAIGRLLTTRIPITSAPGIWVMMSLDLLLVALMLVGVGRAFDWRAALFTGIFLGASMWLDHPHIRLALLRLDWLAALIGAICLLRLGHPAIAGALVGYAGMVRVFPLVFAFGIGARWLAAVVARRPEHRRHLRFLLALGATCAVLAALTFVEPGGLDRWAGFARRITVHNDAVSPWRVGFKYLFLGLDHQPPPGAWPAISAAAVQTFADRQLLWWAIQAVVLGASFVLVQRLEDHEALAFGYVPFFFLIAAGWYYHIVVTTALFLFLPGRERPWRALGAAAVFAVGVALLAVDTDRLDLDFVFRHTCLYLGIVVLLVGAAVAIRRSRVA